MNLTDLKIYGLNFSAFAISFMQVENTLKFIMLTVSIGYTIQKWNEIRKNKK